ncbi:MAG: DPP IV N-terminal domain-containing protein [Bryobacteraceae bacterium]|jgi:dipeptidyl-peptidase-4
MPARSLLLFAFFASLVYAQKKPITIDTLVERGAAAHGDGAPTWAPDGKRLAFFRGSHLMIYDVAAKSEKELLALDALEKAAVDVPEAEQFDWENRRVSENSLEWSASGKQILLSIRGDLFLLTVDSLKWEQLTATSEAERDPKLSPDGERVAFRRVHDLYSLEIASHNVTRLTDDGGPTLLNGELDWVYPEELDLGTAYWWSPDSKHVAYLQFDTAREFVYPQVALGGPRAIAEPERYPQAGTPNADVHLGVVSATGGSTRWMNLGDGRDALFARVYWTPDSSGLAVKRFNRVQNELDLLLADASRGTSRTILHESDPHWINNNDLFEFLADGQFIWGSERDGFEHLYVYGLDGKQRRRLTEGNWEVTEIAGIDETRGKVYFVSSEASPLERQLYSIRLNGKDRTRISQGAGTHSISMSPTAGYYLDGFSNVTEPTRRTLHTIDGAEWSVYRPADRRWTDEYEVLPTEQVNFKGSNGTLFYANLLKPVNFRAGQKYPAVVMVYGGPGAQSVRNSWSGATWEQVLAQRGFVVWQMDNRGSAGRGHAFETPIYHRTGKTELADQLEGLRYLIAQGFVDPARIGIYGWSYGGYMTLYSLLNAPDVFRAGIAGAPVTNWRNYDTIYTERYMGLPSENPDGYKASSPQEYADKLQARLLILGNIEDDNVLFQNTLQMVEAFEKAGKLFDQVIFPQKTHGVGGAFRRELLEKETDFFEKNLK